MKERGFSKLLPAALLAVLLVCAAVLRLGHINWDEFQHVHPDERFIVWVADTVRWPGDLGTALDPASSALNPFRWPPGTNELAGKPRNYAYGHFPLYLLVDRRPRGGGHRRLVRAHDDRLPSGLPASLYHRTSPGGV